MKAALVPKLTPALIARRVERLMATGLVERMAKVVANHPTGGPVVLAPGVIISLFPEDTAAREDHPRGDPPIAAQGHRAPAPPHREAR